MKTKALILVLVPILILALSLPCFGYDSSLKDRYTLNNGDEHPWGGETSDIVPGDEDPQSPSYTSYGIGFLSIEIYNLINQIRNANKSIVVNDNLKIEVETMMLDNEDVEITPNLGTQQKGN